MYLELSLVHFFADQTTFWLSGRIFGLYSQPMVSKHWPRVKAAVRDYLEQTDILVLCQANYHVSNLGSIMFSSEWTLCCPLEQGLRPVLISFTSLLREARIWSTEGSKRITTHSSPGLNLRWVSEVWSAVLDHGDQHEWQQTWNELRYHRSQRVPQLEGSFARCLLKTERVFGDSSEVSPSVFNICLNNSPVNESILVLPWRWPQLCRKLLIGIQLLLSCYQQLTVAACQSLSAISSTPEKSALSSLYCLGTS